MDLASQMTLLDSMLSGVQTEFPDPLSDNEKVAVSAYLVLAHACIEEYAEEVFLKQFDRLSELSHLPITPRAVARLCLAVALSLPDAMRTNMTYKTRTLKGTVTAGRKHYVGTFITKNNGLKENNIKKLAEGIGVEWTSVEGSLHSQLVDLDTLGAKRGEAGHLSPFSPKTLTLKQEAYPGDARGWVEGGRDAVLALEAFLAEDVESALRSLTELRMPTEI
jgi:hypothetical protein